MERDVVPANDSINEEQTDSSFSASEPEQDASFNFDMIIAIIAFEFEQWVRYRSGGGWRRTRT